MASWTKMDGTRFEAELILKRRLARGSCVCCGGYLLGNLRAIGEGVQICGTCNDGGHLDRPGEIEAVLTALLSNTATGTNRPTED